MFLLHLVFVFCFPFNHARNYKLLQAFQQYCPTSVDCGLDTVIDLNITDNTAQECCGQCSCQQDCGRYQSCCFEAENKMYLRTNGKECVDPFIGERLVSEAIGVQGFVMVTQCLDKKESCQYINGHVDIQPVESSTFEVYINEACALCNNVTSFKYWSIRTISKGGAIYSFLHLEDDPTPDETIIFEPSSAYAFPKCYTSSSFVPVDTSTCLSEEFGHLCDDIYLPFFTSYGKYKNIFCYLCALTTWGNCDDTSSKMVPGRFSLLLDNNIDVKSLATYFSRIPVEGGHCGKHFVPHPVKVCICF